MKRSYPEQELQRTVAEYLDSALPPAVFWTSIPAGGGGSVRGAIIKDTGYRAGTPDILLIYRGWAFLIELKAENGRLSDAQRRVHLELKDAQAPVAVCRSLDDVRVTLSQMGVPTLAVKPFDAAVARAAQRAVARRGL